MLPVGFAAESRQENARTKVYRYGFRWIQLRVFREWNLDPHKGGVMANGSRQGRSLSL